MKKLIPLIVVLCLVIINKKTFAQAGSLDLSFGTGGKVATSLSNTGHSYAYASAIQSDGKILAAGYTYFGADIDFALARYNADGSLDISFDGDGKVTTDLGDSVDFCYAVAIQSDGKIILAGETDNFTKVAVVRYNTNGSLDSTFDMDGILTASIGTISDRGYAVTVQSDGKILVAAQSYSGTSGVDFALIRLNSNGSFDSTFGISGKVVTNIYADDIPYAISLQSDGKIVVAGATNTENEFCVVRYNTDGSLDLTFDTDGKVRTNIGTSWDIANSLAIQSDGKIILAGASSIAPTSYQTIVRYNTDGSLDLSFDTDGMVLNALPNASIAQGVKVQNDGKIITIGTHTYSSSTTDFQISRYKTDGLIDSTFGTNGSVITDLGYTSNDFAYATSIQNDGKIIAVGYGYNPSYHNFFLARYNSGVSTSVNNLSPLVNYDIYPNPTTGILHINNQKNDYSIKIVNSIGQEIYTQNCNTNKSEIDVQNLPKGIYFLVLEDNSKKYTSRFVKE